MSWRKGNRLHIVQENEATGLTAEVFDELKATLGIGYVPVCFQAFACSPKFLQAQWRAMKPLLGTREFFELAARLRAESYTYIHNYLKVPALADGLTISQASPVADLLCYAESVVLLMLSVQLQAFEGAVGNSGASHAADRVASNFRPHFIDAETASSAMKRVTDEMRHTLELPYTSDEQRAFAQWPQFFFAYWRALKPAVQSVFHEQAVFRIRESAWSCGQDVPVEVDMEYSRLIDAGVDADEIATITRLTELLGRGAAVTLLDTTFAKIGLEGGNLGVQASRSSEERVA
jgi:Halocarboxylic acid dehydrogenase DehI